ncbi:S-adenosyl-L-methionine-dependent methyltransferase [Microdochium bolleyi]|uniref:S-adenosyl-L-methionine-dependent methyltransferase n=1 Tax=Microdochium bolleyi TaxID=196109 RepID=A0A136JCD1_9PEZI|nr:S-adenosyl-L-methionine-dependent methyltransferase [Microdochium bolleyi]
MTTTDTTTALPSSTGRQEEDAEYLFGDTGNEVGRLQRQHKWLVATLGGKVFFAPVDTDREGMKVLDMACADGTLLREMATRLPPSTTFVGVDLMESFLPKAAETPSNFLYLAQDVLTPLPADLQGAFDLANVRLMFAGVVGREDRAVQNLVDGLAPGGWLQVTEMLVMAPAAKDEPEGVRDFKVLLQTMLRGIGVAEGFPLGLEDTMTEAGLEDVRVEIVDAPIGRSVGGDRAAQMLSVGHFKLTVQALVAGCEKIGVKLPASVTDNLEERFARDALEHGGKFQMVVLTGRKPL